MYAAFFGLSQDPFSIAPDPRFLYMSERHREALAHLLFGVTGGGTDGRSAQMASGGFVLLTGDIGAGKTTISRCFLEQTPPGCHVAYIFNPKLTVAELLRTICDEFHLDGVPAAGGADTGVKAYVNALNGFLLRAHAAGESAVLVIDEAQNLSAEVLEQLRLLTNLETAERKLLQIVLIGQPELRSLLARPELEQLAQRVVARYHLGPLTAEETRQYIAHRMAVAGLRGPLPFSAAALTRIHLRSRGVPRRINLLCGRALLGAWGQGQQQVGRRTVDQAADEVFDGAPAGTPVAPAWRRPALLGALALLTGAAAWLAVVAPQSPGPDRNEPAAPAAAAGAATGTAPPAGASGAAEAKTPLPAVTRAATEPEPPALADEAWLAALPAQPDALHAALTRLWDPAVAPPCAASVPPAADAPLRCWRAAQLTVPDLRRLDRPGLLALRLADDRRVWARLLALRDGEAELAAPDGAVRRMPLGTLATRWSGDWITLWRPPPGRLDAVLQIAGPATGASSPAGAGARWVADALSRAGIGESGPGLIAQMRAFQRAQGLKPDGLPGPQTLMVLRRQVVDDEPQLTGTPVPAMRER
jgi:general secretion pathway protein A